MVNTKRFGLHAQRTSVFPLLEVSNPFFIESGNLSTLCKALRAHNRQIGQWSLTAEQLIYDARKPGHRDCGQKI